MESNVDVIELLVIVALILFIICAVIFIVRR